MKGITSHQLEVLKLIGTSRDSLDLDELLPQLSWEPSKEAAQFTIRALVKKKLITKRPLELRRGRNRVSYELTVDGRLVLDPRGLNLLMKVAEVGEDLPELSED